ncbi:MAG: dTDP-4-dehydrorhamnose 3,5-epimerase [Rhodospirillales bacterium]|nr:dTDP-4-dehydrorhamnose 3,5-epimerase [Rhodospirillales bacterium]
MPDVKLVEFDAHRDQRGYFAEVFRRSHLTASGIELDIVQENASLSVHPGTIRGMHFQTPPSAHAKLVRVVHGAVFDAAVDLRVDSPSFGRWVGVTLTDEAFRMLFIPVGFAHGFCTLVPNTLVHYAIDSEYSADHDKGVLWNDPDIGITWPTPTPEPTLSERDKDQPRLKELPRYFSLKNEQQ